MYLNLKTILRAGIDRLELEFGANIWRMQGLIPNKVIYALAAPS